MKKFFLLFLLFTSLLLTSCHKKQESMTTNEPNHPVYHEQLGFSYQSIGLDNNQLIIHGYLTNSYPQNIEPYSFYIKVYNQNQIFAEDTLIFPIGHSLKAKSVEKVTITIPLNKKMKSLGDYQIYYEYHLYKKPINQTV